MSFLTCLLEQHVLWMYTPTKYVQRAAMVYSLVGLPPAEAS